ncbi:MAG: helix-turn-helix domain-containing protein [Bacilli bacterium]
MKEIGDAFREARGEIGISKEEVIKDLNITESQLDNLEDGNVNAFKDVFFLKDIIKKYSKYLNLDEDEIIDKFNDFIFGYTSRIPLDEILEQTKEINILELKNKENKIVSPYTSPTKKNNNTKHIIIYTLSVIILVILAVLIVKIVTNKELVILENSFIVVKNGGMY